MDKLTRLAGVTFDNEDGSSRQEILKDLHRTKPYGLTLATLVPTKYNNEEAIRVMTHTSKGLQCVGWVPKTDIARCKNLIQVLMQVGMSRLDNEPKATYFACLYLHEKPTNKQYAYAKRKNMDTATLPYSKAAYAIALDTENGKWPY